MSHLQFVPVEAESACLVWVCPCFPSTQSVSFIWQTCNAWSLKFRWTLLTATFTVHWGLISFSWSVFFMIVSRWWNVDTVLVEKEKKKRKQFRQVDSFSYPAWTDHIFPSLNLNSKEKQNTHTHLHLQAPPHNTQTHKSSVGTICRPGNRHFLMYK